MALAPTPMAPRGGGAPPPPSAIGGPSGPGGSPMVSPGPGAGQQAMALGQIDGVMDTLFTIANAFEPGTPELTSILGAIKLLNNLKRKKPQAGGGMPPPPPPQQAMIPGGAGMPRGPLPPGGGPTGEPPGEAPPAGAM